jgi:hypothetical protein
VTTPPPVHRYKLTVTGGRSTRKFEHTNPGQTPERYEQELRDWSAARGFVKRRAT